MVRSARPTGQESRWLRVLSTLNEYQARLFVADKAQDQGRGGMSRLSELTGMSRTTITRAVAELNGRKKLVVAERGQIREAGGGRKKVEEADPELPILLGKILEETSAGDPMSALRWTNQSTEAIADALTRQGHPVSDKTVARCLRKMGYSMQLNQKTREGPQHRNRDRQFRYINRQVASFGQSGDPVLSVDAKKKEWVGPFKNGGRTWRPKGKPERVNVHDFPSQAEGKAIPYGACEVGEDRAVVNVE
jgi:DNA-binding phage protein